MAKKLKKFLKKAGKAAAVAAALYGATKLGRRKKVFPETENINIPDKWALAKRAMTQDTPYPDRIMKGGVGVKSGRIDPYSDYDWSGDETWMKGGGIAKRGIGVALKSGGRVTGIAKRGFGRALMKGKK